MNCSLGSQSGQVNLPRCLSPGPQGLASRSAWSTVHGQKSTCTHSRPISNCIGVCYVLDGSADRRVLTSRARSGSVLCARAAAAARRREAASPTRRATDGQHPFPAVHTSPHPHCALQVFFRSIRRRRFRSAPAAAQMAAPSEAPKWEGGVVLYAGGTDFSKVIGTQEAPPWWRPDRSGRAGRPAAANASRHAPLRHPDMQLGRSSGKGKQTDADKQVRGVTPGASFARIHRTCTLLYGALCCLGLAGAADHELLRACRRPSCSGSKSTPTSQRRTASRASM
jgi:hypothetical protein